MSMKIIATNSKAYRDFFLYDKWECGIALKGSEVKSIRRGNVDFTDSFARVEKGEVRLYNLHISPYAQASYLNPEPGRVRALLLHHREIMKIDTLMNQKHMALVPTKIYINQRGFVKLEIAVGKGKKLYDKREAIKRRDLEREMKRAGRYKRS